MDIQTLIDNNGSTVASLFNAYGIQKPVNYDTVSAAIALYRTENGNAFLKDLAANISDESDYDEIFGLGKKAKAKREERKAAGEPTGFKRFTTQVSTKLRPKPNERQANTPLPTTLDQEAKGSEIANTQQPATKLGSFIDKAVGLVNTAQDVYNAVAPGGKPMPVDEGEGEGEKKWYQKPMVLVGIGVGVLAVIAVVAMAFKSKKA